MEKKQTKETRYWMIVNDDGDLIVETETGQALIFDNEMSAMKYIELIMAARNAQGRSGRARLVKPASIVYKIT